MKKRYIEPEMEVVEVKAGNMICQSQLDVYRENDPDVLDGWDVEKFGW